MVSLAFFYASQQVGLKMNMDMTKIMSNARVARTPRKAEDSALEVVVEYFYLTNPIRLSSVRKTTRYLFVQNTALSKD